MAATGAVAKRSLYFFSSRPATYALCSWHHSTHEQQRVAREQWSKGKLTCAEAHLLQQHRVIALKRLEDVVV